MKMGIVVCIATSSGEIKGGINFSVRANVLREAGARQSGYKKKSKNDFENDTTG